MFPLASCGDDESAQDRYCEAGESLESSVRSLGQVDLVAEGTSGLNDVVDQVRDDVDELLDAASDAAADDVEALQQSLESLQGAITALGGDLTRDNASAVGDAIDDVVAAAQAVFGTLSDC